ncbi:choice-of-anchor L domain-containing protein, partial [Flavobacterium suaedae]|uniref:choice-of-anchor L domain-containing protein n=1 Tax=Flavobacterium suaedae TaxID=1767027 RepID=UPI00166772A5
MKRSLLFLAVLVCSLNVFSQGISVTPHPQNNAAANNQLVNNTLLNYSCLAQVSNVTKSTGTDFGYSQGNGIGTFNNTNGAFPYGSGALLTSGNAVGAQGPNTNTSSFSSPAWVGDADISTILGINSKNATVLEFDFIPANSTFSIEYIFASEEYGQYQCESNDGVIILLTNTTAGTPTQNVAVLPNGDPVSVGNIRDMINNSDCTSVNPEYFGTFYGGGAGATAPINYEGRTVELTANATLVPGDTYHLKIVVADDGDTDGTDGEYDSAVFFPQGGFNLGQVVLGLDLTSNNNTALCEGDTFTLDTGLSDNESDYTFAWTRNNNPIPGGAVITGDEPGTYAVEVTLNGTSCTTSQDIVIEYVSQLTPGAPNDLYACNDGSASYTYDLSQNTPVVKQGLPPATIVTYHATETEANDGTGGLGTTYNSPAGETVWVRVKSHNSSCYVIMPFDLLTVEAPTANQPTDLMNCEETQGSGEAIFDLSILNGTILGLQPVNENTILYYTSQQDADDAVDHIENPSGYVGTTQTIYARVQRNSNEDCYSVTSFELTVVPLPDLEQPDDVFACNSYILPALTTGSYYTGTGGTGSMIAEGEEIIASQTIYIYAENQQGSTTCASQVEFDIEIVSVTSTPEDVSVCGSYTLPDLPSGQFYYNGPDGTGGEIPEGTEITATQVVYFYIPTAAECTGDSSFTVTITEEPVISNPGDIEECGSYILPVLPADQNYYTEANGGGTQLTGGTEVTTSQTIYIYAENTNNPACNAEESFEVVINDFQIDEILDVTRCGTYVLPELTVGSYYTGAGGTGTQLAEGTVLTSSQTIYVYASSSDGACSDEESFELTINPLPVIDFIPNVTTCTSYILPDNLPSGANYYTQSGGQGNIIPPGTEITASQTIYAWATNSFGCARQRIFQVVIIEADDYNPGYIEVCENDGYELAAIPAGGYYTQSGGEGTQLSPGTVITTSQTIFIYIESTQAPFCSDESSFEVVVYPSPNLDFIPDVVACGSYTLPPLNAESNYYTDPLGTGTLLPEGTELTESDFIYVYSEAGGTLNCTAQQSVNITIINGSLAPEDVDACDSYELPELDLGDYYTQPGGGGTQLAPGTEITTTQIIYVYVEVTSGANCTNNDNFTVTITNTPSVDGPEDVFSCVEYTLPPLSNGNYYTGADGTGTMLNAGDIITEDTTLYVYSVNSDNPNCFANNSFDIVISDFELEEFEDVEVCESGYVLPALTIGNYYTEPGGTGTQLFAGDVIDTDQTIYVYATTNTTPVCTDEESFTVTIKPSPDIDTPGNVGSCGTYTLPALSVGEYYTGPGGTGTQLAEGQVISGTTDVYVYAETGGDPNCAAEHMFTVFINPQAPVDVTTCDSYELPELPVGNYYTGPAGTGTQLFAGDNITTTQDIYVYIEMNSPVNCTDNNFFTVTINNTPVLAPVPVLDAMCDSYELPEILVGNYYTEPNGQGTLLNAGELITSTQTVYVYAETGTTPNCAIEDSFDVVIYDTPIVDARSTVERCDEYILDALVVGDYYLLSGGPNVAGQQQFFEGDVITDSMTMYIYAESGTTPNCFSENSFDIDIYSITADNPEDGAVSACDSYTLPELEIGDYYELPGGPDEPGQVLLEAGDIITASQTLYVYAELGGRVNCNDENEFVITIFETPQVDTSIQDVTECFEYELPPLAVGNYYTGTGGTGTMLNAGDIITSSQIVYVYAATGDDEVTCATEHSFGITINSIYVDEIADFPSCDNYVLEPLAVGNYYTGQGGTGTMLPAGTVITETSLIYIYGETNTNPVCTSESDFVVTIVNTPTFNQPAPLYVCGIDDLGHGIFDLDPAVQEALAGQPNVSASVHETMIDADFNNDPIQNTSAYANVQANVQTVYIRIQSDILNTCYTVVELQLNVNPRPQASTPTDYELCDNGSDDTDGEAIFDLTIKDGEVLGTDLDPG